MLPSEHIITTSSMLKHVPFYASLLGRKLSDDTHAQQSHVLLYGAIEAHSFGEKGCIASNDLLAKETGYSVNTIKNSLSEIRSAGWVNATYDTEGNRTQIIPLLIIDTPSPAGDPPVTSRVTPRHLEGNRGNSLGNSIEFSKTKVLPNEIDIPEDDLTIETDEEFVPTKTLRKQNKPKSVEPDILKMWSFWPGDHGQWKINKTMRASSEVLLQEHGLEKIKWAVEFWLDNKKDPFCPDISTPYKLADKYDSLRQYRSKKYGY